jgi:hypothetical protein
MAEDPFDPKPESNWGKIMMVLAGIAIIILGVWGFAASLLSKSLTGQ